MNIIRTGQYTEDDGWNISYKFLVNNQTVRCIISLEALQDIDPSSNQNSPLEQFEAHQNTMLNIAESKIRKGLTSDGLVYVYTADLNQK